MSKKASGYKITDYPFFTGSLGNYAGNERQIPTYTLELPNSDWPKQIDTGLGLNQQYTMQLEKTLENQNLTN